MDTRDFEEVIRMMAEEFARRIVMLIAEEVSVRPTEEKISKIASLCSALSSAGRVRLLLALEKKPRRFRELEVLSGLRGGSLKVALDKFLELGLIENVSGLYRITEKGLLIASRIKRGMRYVRALRPSPGLFRRL